MQQLMHEKVGKSYFYTKIYLSNAGCSPEFEWQRNASFASLCPASFLREYSWVVLNSGMRESVIRNIFPRISDIFMDWKDLEVIPANRDAIKAKCLKLFGNEKKVDSIISTSELIHRSGWKDFSDNITRNGVEFLTKLPFIGDVTAFHLAKNIGFPCCKADRHLVRAAYRFGFESPSELCHYISEVTSEPIPVVDLVIWRCMASFPRRAHRTFQLFENTQGTHERS